MSEPRKSTVQTEARRRAREKAAEFRAREDKLEALAVEFFMAHAAVETIDAERDKAIQALRDRADRDAASARAKADTAMEGMLAEGVSRSEVAARLGIPVRAVPKAAPTKSEADGEREHDEPAEHGTVASADGSEG